MSEPITVTTHTSADAATAWACYTDPAHVTAWNAASDDWCCPEAEADVQPGGAFRYRMAARDGSMAFDYTGRWETLEAPRLAVQRLEDGRRVEVRFEADGDGTRVVQTFDPDGNAPRDLQQAGWQAILDRFGRVAGEVA